MLRCLTAPVSVRGRIGRLVAMLCTCGGGAWGCSDGGGSRGQALGTVEPDLVFRSEALDGDMSYAAYLPPGFSPDGGPYPVVYLLHGYGGDHGDWLELGGARETLDSLIVSGAVPPVMAIMPDAGNSWYVDSDPKVGAGAYETALARDLIAHVDEAYPTRAERSGRAVAGLSMGGFGALHLAFKYPDVFGAAASLSGGLSEDPIEETELLTGAFGSPVDARRWSAESPFGLLPAVAAHAEPPPVFLSTGDDDELGFHEGTVEMYRALQRAGIASELRVSDGGHEWSVWRSALGPAITYLSRVAWGEGPPGCYVLSVGDWNPHLEDGADYLPSPDVRLMEVRDVAAPGGRGARVIAGSGRSPDDGGTDERLWWRPMAADSMHLEWSRGGRSVRMDLSTAVRPWRGVASAYLAGDTGPVARAFASAYRVPCRVR